MRWAIVAVALAAGPVVAGEWEVLAGEGLRAALVARTLTYPDGATQGFKADGTTLYDSGTPQWGKWQVQGRQYCSVWPPSETWACYDVARNGLDLRFTGTDGTATVGRYVDLQ